MIRCSRCRRPLRREPVSVAGLLLGPKCAAAVVGAKPKRRQRAAAPKDERQADLFGGAA